MNDTSRRKFLAAAAAGAGGVAVGTVGLPITSADAATHGRRGKEPVVAWIEDPRSDVLVLMAGEREVTVRDRDLVSRLLHATGGE